MKSGYISIIGAPNSGKSTLINKILGEELAIVSPKPQTTRKKIVGIHNITGAQMIFLDTPGLHESEKPLNKYMLDQVDMALRDADIICYLVDAAGDTPIGAAKVFNAQGIHTRGRKQEIIIVLNKLDTVMTRSWQRVTSEYEKSFAGYELAGISAKTGFGIDSLVAKLAEKLPEGEPFYPDDIYTEHPVRFLVAEIVREQVLHCLHQEVPYSVAVVVDDYKELPGIHNIEASIIVERDSQKGIVLGKGGSMIKKIGQLSRAKIEALVGCKVFLRLFVKVEKDWTRDEMAIKRLHG